MKKTIFFLLLPLFYVSVNAQTYLEGSASVGMLLEHHGNMAILAKEPPYAFSLGVMKQSSGKQSWAPFYNYPRYGLRAMYLSPGDPEDIGQIYALLPSVRFSFLRNRWVNPGLQVGVGAGYVTKPYDPNTNYKNVVLSSHLNVALALDFDIETRITRNIYLRPSVGILHLSNGATLVPNYGLNLLMASLTAGYIFGEEKEEGCFVPADIQEKDFFNFDAKRDRNRRTHLDVFLAGGVKENRVLYDGEKYMAGALSIEGSYRYASQAAVGIAADLFYDSSLYNETLQNPDYQKNLLQNPDASLKEWQTATPGIGINHEFFFGKLSFFTHCGFYIHLNKYNTQFTYQRFAFRYNATDNLRLHLGVKTYYYSGLAADWIELGLGFRIL